jgi:hypothetical protein
MSFERRPFDYHNTTIHHPSTLFANDEAPNFNEIPVVTQPPGLLTKLHPHQLASIYKLEELEDSYKNPKETDINFIKTKVGIFADLTGYGKTLSLIGLILRDKFEWTPSERYVDSTFSTQCRGQVLTEHKLETYTRVPTTLIVVSSTILKQWETELLKTPLKIKVIGSKTKGTIIEEIDPASYDVILTSATKFNNLVEANLRIAWKRFIFDEPGNIRIHNMKPIIAGFYWFVTATPNKIYALHAGCRTNFLKYLLDIEKYRELLIETRYKNIIVRNPDAFVRASFIMPETTHLYHECYNPLYKQISKFVPPNIQTMISAGNIEDVIRVLGGDKTSDVRELVKKNKLRELDLIREKLRQYAVLEGENIPFSQKKFKEIKEKEIKLLKELTEIDVKYKELLEGDCSICLCPYTNPILETACQNLFCAECLFTWMNTDQRCPLCKENLDPINFIYIRKEDDVKESKKDVGKLIVSKQEKVLELLRNAWNVQDKSKTSISKNKAPSREKENKRKFLIFSEYDRSFNGICETLKTNGISYGLIKGNSGQIEACIKNYKYGDLNIIMLNSNYNGSGLNLQETTDIIIYHEMTHDTIKQILGRANRIGRTIPLTVHHLKEIE